MGEFTRNLWAPWRMQYIKALGEPPEQGCFLCRAHQRPAEDDQNHVLWRSPRSLVLLNRFPYGTGHTLVAPAPHQAELDDLPEDVLLELMQRVRDAKRVLEVAFEPQGFNIGMNLGRCAGAGLPDHLHWHVVPRWHGDTNFMPVLGDVRVIPEALDQSCARIRQVAARIGL